MHIKHFNHQTSCGHHQTLLAACIAQHYCCILGQPLPHFLQGCVMPVFLGRPMPRFGFATIASELSVLSMSLIAGSSLSCSTVNPSQPGSLSAFATQLVNLILHNISSILACLQARKNPSKLVLLFTIISHCRKCSRSVLILVSLKLNRDMNHIEHHAHTCKQTHLTHHNTLH